MARLELLGPPRWVGAGGARPLAATLTNCLVVRLAIAGTWLPREAVLPLLWADADEDAARTNLRQLLWALPGHVKPWIERDGGALRFVGACDLVDVDLLEASGAWRRALAVHRGPFLDGFAPRRAAGVAEWLDDERGRWDRAFARVARRAFAAAVATGAVDEAVETGRRWLDRDPLDVDVTVTVVDGLRQIGAEAEAQRVLALHGEAVRAWGLPANDAVARLRSRGPHLVLGTASVAPPAAPRQGAERLVGRDPDLAALAGWWSGPGRWLTLVAPGGMGKTMLARAWADGLARAADVLDLVDLNGVASDEEATRRAVAAIARGSHVLHAGAATLAELVGGRAHLLIVDAAEDLEDGRGTFASWTSAAPGLRLLVTSRRAFGAPGEAVQRLAALPAAPPAGGGASVAAVALWAMARGAAGVPAYPTGVPDAVQRAVTRLGGWPLGLKLLAGWATWLGLEGWLEALDREQIVPTSADATEIVAGSWRHLTEPLREAMGTLAGLPRPWSLADAERLGVSAANVAELAATGWVTAVAGEFTVHPLLAEHAGAQQPARAERGRAEHARGVLLGLIAAYERGGRPPADTYRRLHHVLAAWAWACAAGESELLERGLLVVEDALGEAGRIDAMDACAAAARGLAAGRPRLRRMLAVAALRARLQGDDVGPGLELALELEREARAAGDGYALGRALSFRAVAAYFDDPDPGRADELARAGLAALGDASDRAARRTAAQLANLIGMVAHRRGDDAEAQAWIERAERLALAAGGPSLAADWAHNLAYIDHKHGRAAQALVRNDALLAAGLRDGAPRAQAERWQQRARILLTLGDKTGARAAAEQLAACSAGMHPAARDRWHDEAFRMLAEAALLDDDPEAAERWLERCTVDHLVHLVRAELGLATGDLEGAERAATMALTALQTRFEGPDKPSLVTELLAILATARTRSTGMSAAPDVVAAIRAARARSLAPLVARSARAALEWSLRAGRYDVAAGLLRALERDPAAPAATRRAARQAWAAAGISAPEEHAPDTATGAGTLHTLLDEVVALIEGRASADGGVSADGGAAAEATHPGGTAH
jgi:DNA-binding SARP family transcriptional activator/tetratricopeptide (TPR) repeat protein